MPVELLTSPENLSDWDDLVRRCPAGTLFHTSAWRACAEWRPGDRMLYAGWRDAAGRLRGGVALAGRRRWGLRLGVQPLGTPYLGFIADDDNWGVDQVSVFRKEVFAWLARRFHFAYFQTPPEWPGPAAGEQAPRRWETPARQTPIVALGPEEEMWGRLRGNARRQIRRARDAGWEIVQMERPALFPDEREAARRLLAATHGRIGRTIYPEPFVERLLESEGLDPHRLALWARPGLGAEAGALLAVVFDARRAYYLLPLAEEGALQSGAMYLLVWEAMRHLAARGIPALDLLGANLPHLARFKENFGGEIATYYQWKFYCSPLLRLLHPTN